MSLTHAGADWTDVTTKGQRNWRGAVGRAMVMLRRTRPQDRPAVERHQWGTILRAADRPSLSLHLTQWICWVLGVTALVGGLGLAISAPADLMRLASGGVIAAVALPLLGFASRGSVGEVHLDRETGEVRELVAHRIGAPTLLSAHTLQDLAGVDVTTLGARRHLLALRFGNGDVVPVAVGPMSILSPMVAEIESLMLATPLRAMRRPARRAQPVKDRLAA